MAIACCISANPGFSWDNRKTNQLGFNGTWHIQLMPYILHQNKAVDRWAPDWTAEFVSCGQILQDEDNSMREEKLSPAQIRVKETTYFSFLRSRRPSQLHMCRKAPRGKKKRRGLHSIGGDVNLPIGLFTRNYLAERWTRTLGRTQSKTKFGLWARQTRWLARGSHKEMCNINDSNYHEHVILSESAHVSLFTHTLFPPNKHFTCFTTFHLYVEIHFYKAIRPGPCHWLLVPGTLRG